MRKITQIVSRHSALNDGNQIATATPTCTTNEKGKVKKLLRAADRKRNKDGTDKHEVERNRRGGTNITHTVFLPNYSL